MRKTYFSCQIMYLLYFKRHQNLHFLFFFLFLPLFFSFFSHYSFLALKTVRLLFTNKGWSNVPPFQR